MLRNAETQMLEDADTCKLMNENFINVSVSLAIY